MRRFTHRVGSLHALHMPDGTLVHAFAPKLPAGLDAAGVHGGARRRRSSGSRAEMPVDVFAHPTLLPIPYRKLPLEELWTEAREERAVEALFRAGIAFEVSARYRPHERFVRRAAERGVRLSLGSDGHSRRPGGERLPVARAHAPPRRAATRTSTTRCVTARARTSVGPAVGPAARRRWRGGRSWRHGRAPAVRRIRCELVARTAESCGRGPTGPSEEVCVIVGVWH